MVNTLYTIAFMATFAVFASAATNYCNLEVCKGPNHTVCKYGFLRVNHNQCHNVRTTSLTRSEIQEILNLHNYYRGRVARGLEHRGVAGPQPAARNIRNLSWDRELANVAQTWANQCLPGHDQCRHSARFNVGQNAGYRSSDRGYTAKFTDIVTGWYDEVQHFNRNQVESVVDFNQVVHYTQMLWAETTLVGCGGVRYEDGEWFKTRLVCNYGPAGNWYGEEMYKTR